MCPRPDRSDYTPTRAKTAEDPSLDIGWDEGFLTDGRPYRVECWAEEGVTMLTYFFSTRGLETYSSEQFASFLEAESLVQFLDGRRYVSAMPITDAAGNRMWSVNVVVGDEDDTYINDKTNLRSYWPREAGA
jgi:hypothetical protein